MVVVGGGERGIPCNKAGTPRQRVQPRIYTNRVVPMKFESFLHFYIINVLVRRPAPDTDAVTNLMYTGTLASAVFSISLRSNTMDECAVLHV